MSAAQGDDERYLLAVLKEAQDSVRAFDAKAQIVGIGYIFSLGVIGTVAKRFEVGSKDIDVAWLVVSLVVLIAPIILYSMVIFPSRRTAPGAAEAGGKHQQALYYSHHDGRGLEGYRRDVAACDWRQELITEIVIVSNLRDLKRQRFLRALSVTALAYALYFIGLLVGRLMTP